MKDVSSEEDLRLAVEHGVALVDFSAPWCAPCRAQEPILVRMADRFEGNVSVVTLNVDKCRAAARDFGVRSIPTLIIFKNGKELQRFVGLQSESVLSDALSQAVI